MNDKHEEKPKEEFLLTFHDLLAVIKKKKKMIGVSALVFALLALMYGLTKPVVYVTEATFKEKGKSQSGLNNTLNAAFFMITDHVDSNALTIMRSRALIEDLIKEQHLQGSVAKDKSTFPFIPFETIKNNILLEYASLNKQIAPILSDPVSDFRIYDISYNHEVPKSLSIKVLSPDKFSVYDSESRKTSEGIFGRPFTNENYFFTLSHAGSNPVSAGSYTVTLLPLESTAEKMAKQFQIDPDRSDKNLIKITYKNGDRHLAARHPNALMALYQKYIECEHEEICKKQVDYLIQRQKEMGNVLETMMQDHAKDLSSDLSLTGFATSEKAMEFLAHSQQDLKQKLFALHLEIQRLERTKDDFPKNNDIFSSINHLDVVNKIATEKRSLKQQADSLNLVLRNIPSQSKDFQASFSSQLSDIDSIKKSIKESSLAFESIKKNELPKTSPALDDDSQYIYDAWHQRLSKAKENLNTDPSNKECLNEWEQCKAGFAAYLSNLSHYLNVYQRNIEERLAHQQAPLKEFQGINLNVAGELYISYSKELSQAESSATQHEFIYNQLGEPNFEISSLSTILSDPLSLDMITKASNLILALKDQDNRSSKEQERLNADLAIQKGFLKTHIKQSIALLALRQDFLREKILHLQSLTLSLIQEQISILENQVKEYVASSLDNLHQEKQLIEKNLSELRMEMAAFPQKWTAEQLIDQQMEINKSLVEEISKLVESKNISNNLEKLQSAPVDLAFPPIHPKPPHLVLLTLFGAIAGAFISLLWILGGSVIQGIAASAENLKAIGLQVCGAISRDYNESLQKDPLKDNDLAALRRLISFMDLNGSQAKTQNTLLLLEGKGSNYALPLAELLARKGLKILILELRFDEVSHANTKGILQYMEGKIEEPNIIRCESYDKIESGGICRFANERISSQRFKDLLADLKNRYDWIIINSSALPSSAESENLLDLFSLAVVSISGETLQDLKNCIRRAKDPKYKIAFMV